MISIDHVPDDEPPLDTSPLFRGVLKTAAYIDANGGIGLTKCGAFQPQFVRWAAASFDSPGYSEEELFKLNKVLDEIDFPPVGDIHAPLAGLRLARRRKGMFLLTKAGRDLVACPGRLLSELVPSYLFWLDQAAHLRSGGKLPGNWTSSSTSLTSNPITGRASGRCGRRSTARATPRRIGTTTSAGPSTSRYFARSGGPICFRPTISAG